MRKAGYIAKAELQSFFYSPVAWLILIIFTVRCAVAWCDMADAVAREIALGRPMPSLTDWFFTHERDGRGWMGVFQTAASYLYIFYPLLTMGLISRELANGTIRLLDSSPVTAAQIVWGKFLAMVLCSLLLAGVLMLFVLPSAAMIENFNWPFILVALTGIVLTMLTYSAIGLFLSSLTRYPVVAAIGSFAVFMVLERIGGYGQQWDGVRDVTTWLSISGRMRAFMSGMLASHHLVYFAGMIAMFLAFTVLRLRLAHYHRSRLSKAARYAAVAAVVIGVGWATSRPALRGYADVTETQQNTLSEQSREVMEQLRDRGTLTVTTYVNLMDQFRMAALPRNVSADKAGFERWQRFKPDMKFRYVYYYAPTDKPTGIERMKPGLTFEQTAREIARLTRTPFRLFMTQQEVDRIADLAPEHYRFVRTFSLPDGRVSSLRMYDEIPPWPDETEIAVAFKRLAVDMPRVGFASGHGERSIYDGSATGYERIASSIFNRFSLLNQGLDGVEVRMGDGAVPPQIDILVIADPQVAYSDDALAALDGYIARGGNLVLLVEPDSHAVTTPLLQRFGISLGQGRLAEPPVIELADVVGSRFTGEGIAAWELQSPKYGLPMVAMPGVGSLHPLADTTFRHVPLLTTRPEAWNKKGTVDWIQGDIAPMAERGEATGTFVTAAAITRTTNGREQRIMIAADADWMDNREVQTGRQGFVSRPSQFSYYMFRWLTHGVAPMELRRPSPTDTSMHITQRGASRSKWVYEWALPGALLLAAATILIRRNRK